MKTYMDEYRESPDYDDRVMAEEGFVIDVLETICEWMDREGVSRSELAERLGTSRANITQMLSGRNVSIRTIAAVVNALGGKAVFAIKRTERRRESKTVRKQSSGRTRLSMSGAPAKKVAAGKRR